ncbi:unnamed protein product [Calypogeia fissa]
MKREARKCKLMKCSSGDGVEWSGVEWSDEEAARKRGQWRNEGARKHTRDKQSESTITRRRRTGPEEEERKKNGRNEDDERENGKKNAERKSDDGLMFVPPTVVYAVKRPRLTCGPLLVYCGPRDLTSPDLIN